MAPAGEGRGRAGMTPGGAETRVCGDNKGRTCASSAMMTVRGFQSEICEIRKRRMAEQSERVEEEKKKVDGETKSGTGKKSVNRAKRQQ